MGGLNVLLWVLYLLVGIIMVKIFYNEPYDVLINSSELLSAFVILSLFWPIAVLAVTVLSLIELLGGNW